MMETVPHVTSGLGLRKFQADGFLLTRVYKERTMQNCCLFGKKDRKLELEIKYVHRMMLNSRCYSIQKVYIRLKHEFYFI